MPPRLGPSEGSRMGKKRLRRHQKGFRGPRGLCKAMLDELPDDVLLDIFDFYLDSVHEGRYQDFDAWHTLVHVCRRWRNVVFASPRRLNLQLVCNKDRSVRDMLDIWPPLPMNIEDVWGETVVGNIVQVAAPGHRDRVCSIILVHSSNLVHSPSPRRKTIVAVAAAMQVPFPELAYLELSLVGCAPVLPDLFLGGSAPRLRSFRLTNILFPALPNLLLSANDLVDLRLDDIPHSGYIPPASIVGCLSSLNKLTSLSLGFESPLSRPDQPSPPQSRVVLPVLTNLVFDGASEYLEDLVAHIDTPMLNQLHITFCPKPIFDLPHLKQFIGRAKGLELSKKARLWICLSFIQLNLYLPRWSTLGVRCARDGLQVPSLALLCGQVSHLFSLVEQLDLESFYPPERGAMVSTQFLEIFQLFTATRSLNVSRGLVPLIASALQELIGARATEMLPNLRDLFLEGSAEFGSIMEVMQPFVDARRLSGQPVAVHYLDESGRANR